MSGKRYFWIGALLLFGVLVFLVQQEIVRASALEKDQARDFVQHTLVEHIAPNDIGGLSMDWTRESPTVDRQELAKALERIEAIPSFHGPGWVHRVYVGYQVPPDPPHPLHPKDGYHVLEEWLYVNKVGVVEKILQTSADLQGNLLQEIACAEEICGNLSKAGLVEFKDEPLTQPFQPYRFNQNEAPTLLQELYASNKETWGWMEEREMGKTLFVASYGKNTAEQISQIPGFEGTLIQYGILVDSGVLAHFSLYEKRDGAFVLNSTDDLVLFETLPSNPEIERRIASAVKILKGVAE